MPTHKTHTSGEKDTHTHDKISPQTVKPRWIYTLPNPTQFAMPYVILLKNVSSVHAVGRVSVREHVLAVGRVMLGSWQNSIINGESNPKNGMVSDPVTNCRMC